jgi:hypothetical protein
MTTAANSHEKTDLCVIIGPSEKHARIALASQPTSSMARSNNADYCVIRQQQVN